MRVFTARLYEKKVAKLNPKLNARLNERLQLFLFDPRHTLLNDHQLSGERKGQRSIDITGDYRLIYQYVADDAVLLMDVDTHHNLYGN